MISFSINKPGSRDYYSLLLSTGWNEEYKFSEEEAHKALDASWYMVSGYDGDVLVGFGRVISDGIHHALIADLMVLPSHQGRGIGSKMMGMLMDRCTLSGIRDIQLFSARGKESFYHQFGFKRRPDDAPGMQYKP